MKKGEYNSKEHAEILYNMELHEAIMFSDELLVCRVPGGWTYTTIARNVEDRKIVHFMTSVFVPWNNDLRVCDEPVTSQEIRENMEKCNEIIDCKRDL